MVEREFGVRYHPDHIGRLMHSLGWTPQKPERRALERNEEEIERWKREEWPRIKKTLQGWVPTSSLQTNRASC
jgi:transposase